MRVMASDVHVRPDDPVIAPTRSDPFVRDASYVLGGPVGKHARFGAAAFWNPLRVLIALGMLTFTLGFVFKLPCSYNAWANHFQYTHMCYSDVYALYFSEHLNEGAVPYVDHPVEYPVVIGGFMWTAAQFSDDATDFFNVTAVLLLVCAVLTVVFTGLASGRRRVWDAALVALAPGLVLHGTTNWDLAAVALAAIGMWAWSRRMPAFAGLWFGLAVATKLYPALFLVGLFFLCLRARRLGAWLQAAAVTVATTVLVYLPVVLSARSFQVSACDDAGGTVHVTQPGWQYFFTLNRCRGADWDSLAFAWMQLTDFTISVHDLNTLTAALMVVLVLAVGALTLLAPRRPRVPQVLFLLVAGFLLLNKVNSPQYTLWLVPLAAMARPRWRPFVAWQLAEGLVMFTRFYYFINYDGAGGIPVHWFVWAILLRNALLLVLVVLVVREMLRPYHDVVRREGDDDPAGGVLDGALDWRERSAAAPVPATA